MKISCDFPRFSTRALGVPLGQLFFRDHETAKATTVEASVANSAAPTGAAFEAEFRQSDKSLLSGKTTL